MSSDDYIKKMNVIVNDTTTFKNINEDPTIS